MDNENKNLPEEEKETIEPSTEEAVEAKKPNLTLIIGAAAAGVVVVVGIILAIVLLGGKKDVCNGHVDKNDDGKCDKCSAEYDDGEEDPGIVKESCTFTVIDSDGNKMPGAKFTLTIGSVAETFTSDDKGQVKAGLVAGRYDVEFDYESIPEGFLPTTTVVEVSSTAKTFELLLVNNNPNGTEERPYFISENETPCNLSKNEEIHYILRGGAGKKLVVESDKVSVTFNGETYEPENGIVEISITAGSEVMQINNFSVKNKTSSECQIVIKLVSPLGSMDNPIVMTESSATATVPTDGSVHYKWTASADGVVIVSSKNEKNNISLTNHTTNAVSSITDGGIGVYMMVSEGDEIIIAVSAKTKANETAEFIDIIFNAELYSGTESDPIPVLTKNVDLSFRAGVSLVFSSELGGKLSISDENVSVTYNGTVYNPTSLGLINVTLEAGAIFTVTNTAEEPNGIEFELTPPVSAE